MKDVKLVADISEQPITDYTTFWGKIKGDIEKQEDLVKYIKNIKSSLSNNIDDLKIKLSKLFTINDEYKIEGFSVNEDSEGVVEDFLVITDKKVISLPTKEITKTSQLINDGEGDFDSEGNINSFVTQSELDSIEIPTKTSQLTNDGDGISRFATEEYVDENGGKIDKIEVNGVEQEIVNKTVNINIVNSPLIVHMIPEDGREISDKTFGEIKEAFDLGKSVIFFSYSGGQGSIESTSSIMTYYSYSIYAGDYPSASGSVYTGVGGYNILIDYDHIPQTVEELDSCYLYMSY